MLNCSLQILILSAASLSVTAYQFPLRQRPSTSKRSTTEISPSIRYPVVEYHAGRRPLLLKRDPGLRDTLKILHKQKSALPGAAALAISTSGLLAIAATHSIPLALTAGGVFSLWQLQVLHDAIHATFHHSSQVNNATLFIGSLTSYYGYYTYLKSGHLVHHSTLGQPKPSPFTSSGSDIGDGDELFANHRQKLPRPLGPFINGRELSISSFFRSLWIPRSPYVNMLIYTVGFSYERIMLGVNDVITAILSRNLFFPNKHRSFHLDQTRYARVAISLRAALVLAFGWKALLCLYLSELSWCLPFHPLSAMFFTNHRSTTSSSGECIPTSSVSYGRWYDLLSLNTSLHKEHHDWPGVPFHLLGAVRYGEEGGASLTAWWGDVVKAFQGGEQWYACGGEQSQP